MIDFFSQLFTDLNSFDSIMVLFFLLGSFLIGLFTGRMMINRKLKEVQKRVKKQESELLSIRAEKETLFERSKTQAVELETANGFLKKAKSQLTQTQQDRDQYLHDLQNSKEQMEMLEKNNQAYQDQVTTLNADLQKAQANQQMLRNQARDLEEETSRLRLERNDLFKEKEQLQEATSEKLLEQNKLYAQEEETTNSRINMIENKMERLALENDRLQETILTLSKPQNGSVLNSEDLDAVKERLAQLETENKKLKLTMTELQETDEEVPVELNLDIEEEIVFLDEDVEEIEFDPEGSGEVLEEEISEEYNFISTREKSEIARVKLKNTFGKKIPMATATQKDPLQKINGIGPFIEEQLNNVGIFTFEQISSFDNEIITLITEAIQFFPGRIKRDDWKGQATRQLVKMTE